MPQSLLYLYHLQVIFDGGMEEQVELCVTMSVEHANVALDMHS